MKAISLILGLLLASNSAFAGLPPTTAKGQQDTSAITTFNFQTPNKLATKVAGATLIESGNKNILQNPSFEATPNPNHPGWVQTGIVSPNVETSVVIDGKQSVKLNSPNQTLDFHADSTLYAAQFADGVQGLAMIRAKTTTTDTPIYVCPRTAGAYPTSKTSGCVQIQPTGKWGLYKIPFVLGGTSNGIGITSNSVATTGDVYIDDAFVGAVDLKQDINLMSDTVSYTPVLANAGTATGTLTGKWRRIGDSAEVNIAFVATAAGSGSSLITISLPSGIVPDTNKLVNNQLKSTFAMFNLAGQTAGSYTAIPAQVSGNNIAFRKTANATSSLVGTDITSNSQIEGTITFPVVGWSGNTALYSSTNADTDWVDFTPTGAWTTNTTYTGKYKRDRSDAIIQYKLALAGAPNVANMDLNLPTGLLIDSNKMLNVGGTGSALIESGGVINDISAANFDVYAIYLGSTSSVRVSYRAVSGAIVQQASVNATAPMTWAVGDSMTLTIRVPIQGWDNSNSLTGSFKEIPTTQGSTGTDLQSVFFGTGATCGTQCSTGTCTICNQVGNKITSVTWVSTGVYRLNGIDGTKYNCTGSGVGAAWYPFYHDRNSSSSTFAQISSGTTAAANSAHNSVICIGIP